VTLVALMVLAACSSNSPSQTIQETPAAPVKPVASATPIEIVTEPAGDWLESACSLPIEYVERIRRGYVKDRSPEILFVPREPNFFGGFTSTTHSGPWDYVQRVPIVFYGPGFIQPKGEIELDREVTLADIAPTLANLLRTPFPKDRPGRAITEALVPAEQRPGKPRMILVVVWDGGGWDVLETWPNAWPFLDGLMQDGTSITNAIVGSSPSVTPAVHATIGTGTFPKEHGIVDIPIRVGADIVGAYDGRSGQYMEVTTLADIYDQETNNKAKIGMLAYKSWHLGMIGKGAQLPGGDRDIAVIAEKSAGDLVSNETYYTLPEYLQHVQGFDEDVRMVDLEDGKLDNKWMGHEVLDDPSELRHTPAWSLYQTRLLTALFDGESFGQDNVSDLFYTNYKQVDDVGHDWNMLNPEMREILKYSDGELEKLVDYLDQKVGKRKWVVAFTADHGQSPDPMAAQAWPVRIQLLQDDVSKEFDHTDNGVDLFQDERPVGFWLDAAEMAANDVTEEDISNFLVDYRLEENLRPGEKVPDQYKKRLREPILAAAFPSDEMGKIWSCAKRRA
jgi:arylsulfatase A-like enzyme